MHKRRIETICSHLVPTTFVSQLETVDCKSDSKPPPTLSYTSGKILRDQVAIITGAGQGIGEGISNRK
jgi:hypothetical protein